MTLKYHYHFKTMGPRAAQLITELNERRRSTFKLADVLSITGLSAPAARNLVQKACQRGVVMRLKPGLYNLVPFELGRTMEHVDSPYLIAHELVGPAPYFLSHATAFELHRMVTQPSFTIHTSCTRRIRPQKAGGYEFHFTFISADQVFGTEKHWIDKERFVMISDLERTILDGLCHPEHVGGVTEIAKGLWMKRQAMDMERLVDYALRLDVGAILRRLGYLLEHYGLAGAPILDRLRSKLTPTYQRLDPLLAAQGTFLSRWKLQLNVTPEELDAVRLG